MKILKPLKISGLEVTPLIEGGKGISISNGRTAGAWAAAGGVGTFSAVYADTEQENYSSIKGSTRNEKNKKLIEHAIQGGITQAQIAYEYSNGKGRVHMNILWGIASVEKLLDSILKKAKGIIHGVTCGAGMPYKISNICASHKTYYYPIISSARAFNALWKRNYHKFSEWLGGVIYEDPWSAGGHIGLTNNESPNNPESTYKRVVFLRKTMNAFKLENVPIIIAGGVWYLREWQDWIDNKELGPIAFQIGTRALLTKESPIVDTWNKKLLNLKDDDICINHFSPTGFYSSAVKNNFIKELISRSKRQVKYSTNKTDKYNVPFPLGEKKTIYIMQKDELKIKTWKEKNFTKALKTPDSTLIFVSNEKAKEILKNQMDCVGCLSYCKFSNWYEHKQEINKRIADPRSYCIQKTLQSISHKGNIENNLMFLGKNAHLFKTDPFYKNGFIPTTKELINRLKTGN